MSPSLHQSGLEVNGVRYELRLVEEAVLRAARTLSRGDQRVFRRQRDVIYEIADPDAREIQFDEVHQQWFVRMRLGIPLDQALSETPELLRRTDECRVASAVSRKDEFVDLFDRDAPQNLRGERSGGGRTPPERSKVMLVRLRPESFLVPTTLLQFLRHEFLHVADMVDPRFGYRKELPSADAGPSYDNILRNRYRVVWDTTIDGRLQQGGFLGPEIRDVRLRDFTATFPMLGPEVSQAFSCWFAEAHPTHEQIAAFIRDPTGVRDSGEEEFAGRCPVCRFPTAALDPRPERLSPEAQRELQADNPRWRLEQGLCSQCADLYQARGVQSRSSDLCHART
jgi:hypothetical protein